MRTRPFPAWPVWDHEEEEAALRVVRSGHWGCLHGGEVTAFEQEFAAFHDSLYGVAVTNGSAALRLALLAAGIGAGDEVILPPYTFLASASAIVEANAVPVFADIHPDSYCLDPTAVERAITERTRAIIVVHLGGQAADMDALIRIARVHNLVLIEDAAHAHAGVYQDRKLGSWGDMGCFSFQASKNLNAGEGGVIVTSDEGYERICRSLHNCGRMPGSGRFGHAMLGGNSRMTEFQGAILRCGLARLAAQTEQRNANGLYLNERLGQIPGIRPLPRAQGQTVHSYHLYVFRYSSEEFGVPRARFLEALAAEGIPCSPGYALPLYEQEVFMERQFGPYSGASGYCNDVALQRAACPSTEVASKSEGCWLFQSLLLGDRDDMDDIVRAVTKIHDLRHGLSQA